MMHHLIHQVCQIVPFFLPPVLSLVLPALSLVSGLLEIVPSLLHGQFLQVRSLVKLLGPIMPHLFAAPLPLMPEARFLVPPALLFALARLAGGWGATGTPPMSPGHR
jgi:hypothetical protein